MLSLITRVTSYDKRMTGELRLFLLGVHFSMSEKKIIYDNCNFNCFLMVINPQPIAIVIMLTSRREFANV